MSFFLEKVPGQGYVLFQHMTKIHKDYKGERTHMTKNHFRKEPILQEQ
jgi:hypothetical protein